MFNDSSWDSVSLSGVTPCEYDESTLNISFCCMEGNINTSDATQAAHHSSSIYLPSSGPFYLLKVSMSILKKEKETAAYQQTEHFIKMPLPACHIHCNYADLLCNYLKGVCNARVSFDQDTVSFELFVASKT